MQIFRQNEDAWYELQVQTENHNLREQGFNSLPLSTIHRKTQKQKELI